MIGNVSLLTELLFKAPLLLETDRACGALDASGRVQFHFQPIATPRRQSAESDRRDWLTVRRG